MEYTLQLVTTVSPDAITKQGLLGNTTASPDAITKQVQLATPGYISLETPWPTITRYVCEAMLRGIVR